MENLKDEELISLYFQDKEEALEILVSRYLKPVYNFIYRLTNGSVETEDLTEETFIKAWKNLRKFNRKKNFKTWLFTIAKNTVIDFFKKKKETPFSFINSFSEDKETYEEKIISKSLSLEEIVNQDFNQKILEEALKKLPLNYQMVLFLHYNDHLTFQEISEIFQKPLNTVKSWHFRALRLLKEILPQDLI